jgi:hypothetical protein
VHRRTLLRGAVVIAGGAVAFGVRAALTERTPLDPPYLAFSDVSEWNNPLPTGAPVDPASDAFISELKSFDPHGIHPRLVDTAWAEPIYWAANGDPEYTVSGFSFPIRIPANASPAATRDSQLTVFDVGRGYVMKLHRADFDGTGWTATGGSLYYLASNGLIGRLPESDDVRNHGHRGFPPAIHAVRWDEVQAGEIAHVVKVAIRQTAPEHVYPAGGDERGNGIIPEGAMLRIRPSIDLASRGLSDAARVIATAMQRYGMVVGDQSGVPFALKLENLSVEGKQERWSDVEIGNDSLSAISFDDLECIRLGYHRPVAD